MSKNFRTCDFRVKYSDLPFQKMLMLVTRFVTDFCIVKMLMTTTFSNSISVVIAGVYRQDYPNPEEKTTDR